MYLPTEISWFWDGVEYCIYDYPAWIECACDTSPDCLLAP